jgi:membrane protease YdiL (CAAX protease family)
MSRTRKPVSRRHRGPAPWYFLLGTLAWTGLLQGVIAFAGAPMLAMPWGILWLLGGLGPAIVATVLIRHGFWDANLDPSALAYWKRSLDPRTLTPRGAALVALLAIVLAIGPLPFDPDTVRREGWIVLDSALLLAIGLAAGLVEEVGWRGYAQEALQHRMSVLSAALVIGVVWGLWHLPLFFIEGTHQHELGLFTAEGAGFFVALLVGVPVYAWLYNVTGRAVLAAILYHGLSNALRVLVPDVSNTAEIGVEAALSLAVIACGRHWMRQPMPADRGTP